MDAGKVWHSDDGCQEVAAIEPGSQGKIDDHDDRLIAVRQDLKRSFFASDSGDLVERLGTCLSHDLSGMLVTVDQENPHDNTSFAERKHKNKRYCSF